MPSQPNNKKRTQMLSVFIWLVRAWLQINNHTNIIYNNTTTKLRKISALLGTTTTNFRRPLIYLFLVYKLEFCTETVIWSMHSQLGTFSESSLHGEKVNGAVRILIILLGSVKPYWNTVEAKKEANRVALIAYSLKQRKNYIP